MAGLVLIDSSLAHSAGLPLLVCVMLAKIFFSSRPGGAAPKKKQPKNLQACLALCLQPPQTIVISLPTQTLHELQVASGDGRNGGKNCAGFYRIQDLNKVSVFIKS